MNKHYPVNVFRLNFENRHNLSINVSIYFYYMESHCPLNWHIKKNKNKSHTTKLSIFLSFVHHSIDEALNKARQPAGQW